VEQYAVTGGLSYIGKYIAKQLIMRGHRIVVLTGHPNRPNPFGDRVRLAPFHFDNARELVTTLKGTKTLFNTYWVRFDHGPVSFERAMEQTRRMIRAAEQAGVEKIVHLSVSNPTADSPFPYFRGKAVLEEEVRRSKLTWTIVRPTLVFGGEDEILVNNIAWLLRRFPIFAVPAGSYRLQPIFVEEVAELAVNAADTMDSVVVDAAGPEALTFEDMVRLMARKIGSHALIFPASPRLCLLLLRVLGVMVHDVVLTKDEIGALTAELLLTSTPPVGRKRFGDWLDQNATTLGRRYASELNRHYR
jgi:uncharacterized protein YbjT (DUF2867 family)